MDRSKDQLVNPVDKLFLDGRAVHSTWLMRHGYSAQLSKF